MENSTISSETRTKIIEAAKALQEQSGKLPTVDQVRRSAKVDMNAASLVMKEWRRSLQSSPPMVVAIPDSIQQSLTAAAATIWTSAQELANEGLKNAQAIWEIERGDLETMRSELAQAFQDQELENGQLSAKIVAQEELINSLKTQITSGEMAVTRLSTKLTDREEECERLRIECDEAKQKAARIEGAFDALKEQNAALIASINSPKK